MRREGGASGRRDSNPRPQRPERCALTKLRYFPSISTEVETAQIVADAPSITTLAIRRPSISATR